MAKSPNTQSRSFFQTIKRFLIGDPRNLKDRSIFHRLSLIPFLAWVGLGADGLSSSAYGPEEAFKTLGQHQYLAVALVVLMAFTVLIISAAYKRIIAAFPHGGGGYVVASKLLGRKTGVVSGCALLVDYALTITVSIAAAGDALFSFIPLEWHAWKLTIEIGFILFLIILNIRGVKESVLVLTPIFIVFVLTHAFLIGWGIISHVPELPHTTHTVITGFNDGMNTLGPWALFLLFIHAYSLGGGTYTGIEAVSNGLPIMREPKVETAKRTMNYMGFSLAFTAAGLLLCYLLWQTSPIEGKTLNAVLLEQIAGGSKLGMTFVIVSLLSEGLLLVVAAQAGFIDGPRVLANMAVDSWVPRRFAALSDRLTTANGIVLMGITSLIALVMTHGNVSKLVVMYSINVFLTFSLSILGMLIYTFKNKEKQLDRMRALTVFLIGFALCAVILVITVLEKFTEGGWITLLITGALVLLCFWIKGHYLQVAKKLNQLPVSIQNIPTSGATHLEVKPHERTAAILVGGYGGLGIHTVQSILKTFPGLYKNFVFVSVGVVDSGGFKGEDSIDQLQVETKQMLEKYVELGEKLGIASTFQYAVGTDIAEVGTGLCEEIAKKYPSTTFFTGKIIFEREKWCERIFHNETGFTLQKNLQLSGLTMVILPAKV